MRLRAVAGIKAACCKPRPSPNVCSRMPVSAERSPAHAGMRQWRMNSSVSPRTASRPLATPMPRRRPECSPAWPRALGQLSDFVPEMPRLSWLTKSFHRSSLWPRLALKSCNRRNRRGPTTMGTESWEFGARFFASLCWRAECRRRRPPCASPRTAAARSANTCAEKSYYQNEV